VIAPGAQVHGFIVKERLDAPASEGAAPPFEQLLAVDGHGGRVVFRVPADTEAGVRLRLEHQVARQHAHEGIVGSVGLVEHEGRLIQVVEHVDGRTLASWIALGGPLPAAAVCRVGRLLALALVELHERAVPAAHGALSCARVSIDRGGNVRLLDVGRADPHGPQRARSPERRRDRTAPSAGDDLYALGVLLADAATGHVGADALDDTALEIGAWRDRLPQRLVDALGVLVAPAGERLKTAAAAVRVLSELEKHFGDGAAALRRWLHAHAPSRPPQREDSGEAKRAPPPTLLDVTAREALPGLSPPRLAPTEPRLHAPTMALDRRLVLDVEELRRVSHFAEEVARRQDAAPSPGTLEAELEAVLEGDVADTIELAAAEPSPQRRDSSASPVVNPAVASPAHPKVSTPPIQDAVVLDAEERRAVRSGLGTLLGMTTAVVVGAALLAGGIFVGMHLFDALATR
jgi:hypothetical protein